MTSQIRSIVIDYNRHMHSWNMAKRRGSENVMEYENGYLSALESVLIVMGVEYKIDEDGFLDVVE